MFHQMLFMLVLKNMKLHPMIWKLDLKLQMKLTLRPHS